MQENTKLIVEYQELDKNLKAIEDELNGSEVAKKYLVARKFLSTVKESLSDLDKKAQVATDSYNASVKELESLVSSAKELESSLDGCETEEEIEYLKKKYQDASAKISLAEQKVNALSKEMADLYNEYRKLGQQNKVMKAVMV